MKNCKERKTKRILSFWFCRIKYEKIDDWEKENNGKKLENEEGNEKEKQNKFIERFKD